MSPSGTCDIGNGHWTHWNDGAVFSRHAVTRITLNEEAVAVAEADTCRPGPDPYYDRVNAAAGDVLCTSGEPLNALYLIRSGEVELLGQRRRHVLGPGQIFGELGFRRSSESAWTARALSEATLLRIDGGGLQQRLEHRRGHEPLRLQGLTGWDDRLIFECESPRMPRPKESF